MMDTKELGRLTTRWSDKVGKQIKDCPPEARVATGNYAIDKQLHYFEQESGMLLDISKDGGPNIIKGYEIVDEKKFAWFMLRWS